MKAELGFSTTELTHSFATNTGALSVGCLLFVPLALCFGRRPVYLCTALLITGSAAWASEIRTKVDLFGAQVLLGLAGAVNETLFQVTVGTPLKERYGGIYLMAELGHRYLTFFSSIRGAQSTVCILSWSQSEYVQPSSGILQDSKA